MSHTQATAHVGAVRALAFLPNDRAIVSVGDDAPIVRWKVPKLKREYAFEQRSEPVSPIRDVAVCDAGSTIAVLSSDGRVALWAAADGRRVGPLDARHAGRFDVLAVSLDGRRLIAAGGPRQIAAAGPGSIEMWDLNAIHTAARVAELPDWRSPQLDE
jgi:WD40 repeat protein